MQRRAMLLVAAAALILCTFRSRPSGIDSGKAAFDVMTSSYGYVQVSGDVKHPGVYPVSANQMAISVINMAEPGCALSVEELHRLERIVLSSGNAMKLDCSGGGGGRVTMGSISSDKRIVLGMPLEINRMSREDWDRLPGVGRETARLIVEFRQNNGGLMRPEDLQSIPGIGDTRYQQLKKYFK